MNDTFLSLAGPCEGLYKEKGSKFLAFGFYVDDKDEVKKHLDALKKKYFDATHHCYAFVLGKDRKDVRANDDGEPNGTAGLPILNQLHSKQLTNILLVVVRYYGGTKLGASGLTAAYKLAAAAALEGAELKEYIVKATVHIHFPYESMNAVMKICKESSIEYISQEFDNQCILKGRLREAELEAFCGKLAFIGVQTEICKVG